MSANSDSNPPRLDGAVVTALDALWAKHRSGWRRLLSRGIVTELSLRASFDLDLLVPTRIANTIASGTIPDCASCDDICCAGLENVVSLRLVDVARLIDAGRTDLIATKKPRFPESMFRTRPALYELMGSELYRTLPVLRQITDRRICAALQPDMTCGLHPHWPLSCERFPYSLSAVRRRIVWGERCGSKVRDPEHAERSEALAAAAVKTFNERVRDAVLLAHARPALDAMGIGAFLTDPYGEPFEAPGRLPIF